MSLKHCLLVLALALAPAWPAEAHIVYFKDGTVVRGTVTIKDASLTVKGGGAELSFPLEAVRAISFSDEPIGYEQRPREEARPAGPDWPLWTVVGVNSLVAVVALVALFK